MLAAHEAQLFGGERFVGQHPHRGLRPFAAAAIVGDVDQQRVRACRFQRLYLSDEVFGEAAIGEFGNLLLAFVIAGPIGRNGKRCECRHAKLRKALRLKKGET